MSRVAANKAGDNHFPALARQPRRGLCLFLEIAQQRAISKEINLTCSQLHSSRRKAARARRPRRGVWPRRLNAPRKLVPLCFQQAVDPLLGLLEQAATRASAEVSRVAANKAGDNHFPALARQPRRGLCLFLEIAQQRAISKEINLTCSQLHSSRRKAARARRPRRGVWPRRLNAPRKLVPLCFQQAVDPLLGLLEQAATRASAEVSRVAANKAGDNHFPALARQPRRGLCLFLEIAQQRAISKEINLTCSQLHSSRRKAARARRPWRGVWPWRLNAPSKHPRLSTWTPQASASLWAKRRDADLPEVIPTVLPLLGDTLKAAEQSIKVVLIDTPPKNADIAIAAAKAADLIIIPCRPQIDDIETLPATKQVLDVTGNKPTFVLLNGVPSNGITFKRSRRFNNRPSGRCFHRVQAHLWAPRRIRGFFRSRPHSSGI